MKRSLAVSILLFLAVATRAQFPVHPDSIYTFIKHNSVWKSGVNWKDADTSFRNQLKKAKTDADTIQCFVPILEKLNDVHSYFIYNKKYYHYNKPVDSFSYQKIEPLLTLSKNENGKISTRLFPNGVIYIRIPGMNVSGTAAVNQAAQALHDSLMQYSEKRPRGVIIDLRLNTGGNAYPMLAGLSPVLGNGLFAFEIDSDDKLVRKWAIDNGDLAINGNKLTSLAQPFKPVFEKLPVAVLTSPITASSGSMVAIAFRNRPNTASFGENTADGYTTSNGYFQYAPNLSFNFASAFIADRGAKVHKHYVEVDIPVYKDKDFGSPYMDETVITACKWLLNR